jgi:hypothetical protein
MLGIELQMRGIMVVATEDDDWMRAVELTGSLLDAVGRNIGARFPDVSVGISRR